MDLNSILEKTKSKSEKIKQKRPPVNIATEDRPYDNKKSILVNQIETDRKQAANELQSNFNHTANQLQTNSKPIAKVAAKPLQTERELPANQLQTNFKTDCNLTAFSDLVSLQKDLMILFYFDCKQSGSRITGALTLEYLFSQTNAPIKSLKSATYRLEKKMLVIRVKFKNGRGGWTQYEIPESIYREIYQLETGGKLTANALQTDFKLTAKLAATELHYSSSKNTTTEEVEEGDEWHRVDVSPLEKRGLHKNSLLQLKNKNSPDVVQQSILHFAFTLEHNEKYKTHKDPLSVLISVLKRGEAWVDPNYVSPRQRAIQALLEAEKEGQRKEELAAKELFDLKFNAWMKNLDDADKDKITSHSIPSESVKELEKYFKKNLWPEIKKAWS